MMEKRLHFEFKVIDEPTRATEITSDLKVRAKKEKVNFLHLCDYVVLREIYYYKVFIGHIDEKVNKETAKFFFRKPYKLRWPEQRPERTRVRKFFRSWPSVYRPRNPYMFPSDYMNLFENDTFKFFHSDGRTPWETDREVILKDVLNKTEEEKKTALILTKAWMKKAFERCKFVVHSPSFFRCSYEDVPPRKQLMDKSDMLKVTHVNKLIAKQREYWHKEKPERMKHLTEELKHCPRTFKVYGTLKDPKNDEITYADGTINHSESNFISWTDFEKYIFPCGIIIYDITRSREQMMEAKLILNMLIMKLSTYNETERGEIQAMYGAHTFIIISSLMSWGGTDFTFLNKNDCVGEELLRKRIPDLLFRDLYDLENYFVDISIQYKHLLKVAVIGCGLRYGHTDSEIDLISYWGTTVGKYVPIVGFGKNIVPVVHNNDVIRFIYRLLCSFPEEVTYFVLCEDFLLSQKLLMETISSALMPLRSIRFVPPRYTLQYNFSEDRMPHMIVDNIAVKPTFVRLDKKFRLSHNIRSEDYTTFTKGLLRLQDVNYRPVRIMIVGSPTVGKTMIAELLSDYYQVPILSPKICIQRHLSLLEKIESAVIRRKTKLYLNQIRFQRKEFQSKFDQILKKIKILQIRLKFLEMKLGLRKVKKKLMKELQKIVIKDNEVYMIPKFSPVYTHELLSSKTSSNVLLKLQHKALGESGRASKESKNLSKYTKIKGKKRKREVVIKVNKKVLRMKREKMKKREMNAIRKYLGKGDSMSLIFSELSKKHPKRLTGADKEDMKHKRMSKKPLSSKLGGTHSTQYSARRPSGISKSRLSRTSRIGETRKGKTRVSRSKSRTKPQGVLTTKSYAIFPTAAQKNVKSDISEKVGSGKKKKEQRRTDFKTSNTLLKIKTKKTRRQIQKLLDTFPRSLINIFTKIKNFQAIDLTTGKTFLKNKKNVYVDNFQYLVDNVLPNKSDQDKAVRIVFDQIMFDDYKLDEINEMNYEDSVALKRTLFNTREMEESIGKKKKGQEIALMKTACFDKQKVQIDEDCRTLLMNMGNLKDNERERNIRFFGISSEKPEENDAIQTSDMFIYKKDGRYFDDVKELYNNIESAYTKNISYINVYSNRTAQFNETRFLRDARYQLSIIKPSQDEAKYIPQKFTCEPPPKEENILTPELEAVSERDFGPCLKKTKKKNRPCRMIRKNKFSRPIKHLARFMTLRIKREEEKEETEKMKNAPMFDDSKDKSNKIKGRVKEPSLLGIRPKLKAKSANNSRHFAKRKHSDIKKGSAENLKKEIIPGSKKKKMESQKKDIIDTKMETTNLKIETGPEESTLSDEQIDEWSDDFMFPRKMKKRRDVGKEVPSEEIIKFVRVRSDRKLFQSVKKESFYMKRLSAIRKAKAREGKLGSRLVSELINETLFEEHMAGHYCHKGFILDGFPRQMRQAKIVFTKPQKIPNETPVIEMNMLPVYALAPVEITDIETRLMRGPVNIEYIKGFHHTAMLSYLKWLRFKRKLRTFRYSVFDFLEQERIPILYIEPGEILGMCLTFRTLTQIIGPPPTMKNEEHPFPPCPISLMINILSEEEWSDFMAMAHTDERLTKIFLNPPPWLAIKLKSAKDMALQKFREDRTDIFKSKDIFGKSSEAVVFALTRRPHNFSMYWGCELYINNENGYMWHPSLVPAKHTLEITPPYPFDTNKKLFLFNKHTIKDIKFDRHCTGFLSPQHPRSEKMNYSENNFAQEPFKKDNQYKMLQKVFDSDEDIINPIAYVTFTGSWEEALFKKMSARYHYDLCARHHKRDFVRRYFRRPLTSQIAHRFSPYEDPMSVYYKKEALFNKHTYDKYLYGPSLGTSRYILFDSFTDTIDPRNFRRKSTSFILPTIKNEVGRKSWLDVFQGFKKYNKVRIWRKRKLETLLENIREDLFNMEVKKKPRQAWYRNIKKKKLNGKKRGQDKEPHKFSKEFLRNLLRPTFLPKCKCKPVCHCMARKIISETKQIVPHSQENMYTKPLDLFSLHSPHVMIKSHIQKTTGHPREKKIVPIKLKKVVSSPILKTFDLKSSELQTVPIEKESTYLLDVPLEDKISSEIASYEYGSKYFDIHSAVRNQFHKEEIQRFSKNIVNLPALELPVIAPGALLEECSSKDREKSEKVFSSDFQKKLRLPSKIKLQNVGLKNKIVDYFQIKVDFDRELRRPKEKSRARI